MKKEVKQSATHFDKMDVIDRARQDAIEALATRVEALTWTIAVTLVIFVSSVLIMVLGK